MTNESSGAQTRTVNLAPVGLREIYRERLTCILTGLFLGGWIVWFFWLLFWASYRLVMGESRP